MSDQTPLNPVQVEAELINASNSVAKSIQPVSDAYNEWQQAKLNFKREYAIAYLTLPARLRIVSRSQRVTRCLLRRKKSSQRLSIDGWQTFRGHTVTRLPFIKR